MLTMPYSNLPKENSHFRFALTDLQHGKGVIGSRRLNKGMLLRT